MKVRVRRAKLDDYHDLCDIYAELDELHRDKHPELFVKPSNLGRSKSYIEELINNDTKALFVAECQHKIVGLAECYIVESPNFPILKKRKWVLLDNIAVRKEFKSVGIGTSLLSV